MAIHLDQVPFKLSTDAAAWVHATRDRMTLADKVAQVFVLLSMGPDEDALDDLIAMKPGGITRFFGSDRDREMEMIARARSGSEIPLVVAADLEGSRMSLAFGTEVPNPLALAAVNDLAATAEISRIMAVEAAAAGVNWSFTPVLDINAAFRSAIVATRGFGSDVAVIGDHATTQLMAFQDHGIAATLKHWPGEGHDDRDQHLVTTINPLDMDEWNETHGRLYARGIEAGVLAVMSAHIALPSYARTKDPDSGIEAYRPASVSPVLNIDLLRGELGFNGLNISDASEMAGLTSWCRAQEGKIAMIVGGCDMILFSRDPRDDMAAVREAVEAGVIPAARLDDAVTRVLALKATLGLHNTPALPARAVIGSKAHREAAARVTQRAPTLVKDTQNLLPLSVDRHRRVLVISGGIISPVHPEPINFDLPAMLEDEGFDVTMFAPGLVVAPENFDLVLYLFGEETLLTRNRIFLDWAKLSGTFIGAMDRFWHDIPTAMISFGYPYYLYDAPRVPTYVNAYATARSMQVAVANCLMGRAPWRGSNPVDPFCGLDDARH